MCNTENDISHTSLDWNLRDPGEGGIQTQSPSTPDELGKEKKHVYWKAIRSINNSMETNHDSKANS